MPDAGTNSKVKGHPNVKTHAFDLYKDIYMRVMNTYFTMINDPHSKFLMKPIDTEMGAFYLTIHKFLKIFIRRKILGKFKKCHVNYVIEKSDSNNSWKLIRYQEDFNVVTKPIFPFLSFVKQVSLKNVLQID